MRRRSVRAGLLRRIWLPRWLYESLPWLYLVIGALALAGGLFGPEAFWHYPYLALLGLAICHAGLRIALMRYRARRVARRRARTAAAV